MCGIIGFFNFDDANELVIRGLNLIKNRGLDGFGIAAENQVIHNKTLDELKKEMKKSIKKDSIINSAIGHNLHSIVNLVYQPLHSNSSKFAINGEIYNWKELDKKYNFNSKNDSELVFNLIEKKGIDSIEELDGVYAFVYWKNDKVILCRDIIGVKPIWFSLDERLAFCSEKKVLINAGLKNIEELNPRLIIEYDIKTKTINIIKRKFFDILPEIKETPIKIIENVKNLLQESIKKRIPDKKFGILFSGGIDSTFIAYACKQLGLGFTCYTAALDNLESEAPDFTYAKKVAEKLGLKLKYKLLKLDEVENYLKKVVPLIEDSNVVKAGVGLTFYVACELAKKDDIKIIFSGLGSEELFAGYDRHKKSLNVNGECLSGLRKIYERDMYRDDVITMNNNIELRLPFLDKKLAEYSLKIPAKYKLNNTQSKIILREAAQKMGVPEEITSRPKKAAQYGSYFDKAIEKLSKKNGYKFKSEYLKQFYPYENLKLAALISGGKDSLYAAYIMKKQNYELSCFVSIVSENRDSYMFHTPNINLVDLQAKACDVPLITKKTKGIKEEELNDLKEALVSAREKYNIQGVVTGAIFSNYQRERIEKVCDELGLKIFSPLWHMNQELLMRNLIEEGFVFIFSSIAADGLSKSCLGKVIENEDIDKLVETNNKIKLNIAGEGGEFESFVLDCPLFSKKIKITKSKTIMENSFTGRFIIEGADLI